MGSLFLYVVAEGEGEAGAAFVGGVNTDVASVGKDCVLDDGEAEAVKIADKICGLRVFEDENGKMNLNPEAAGCPNLLIISQFTLFADCKSRRPGFSKAARPEKAIPLYEKVISLCRERGFSVGTGEIGADMLVESVNDGPVTICMDTKNKE